jgi:hypothetical protein
MELGLGGDTLAFTQVLEISQYITLTHPGYACAIITRTINQIILIHNAVLLFMYQFSLNVQTFVSLIPFYTYISPVLSLFFYIINQVSPTSSQSMHHHNIIHYNHQYPHHSNSISHIESKFHFISLQTPFDVHPIKCPNRSAGPFHSIPGSEYLQPPF